MTTVLLSVPRIPNMPFALVLLFIAFSGMLPSQNIDLSFPSSSGNLSGMAGAGVAEGFGISTLDLNPAGIAACTGISLSVATRARYHKYSLLDLFESSTSLTHEWDETRVDVDHVLVGVSPWKGMSWGGGYVRKFDPFTENRRNAITGSVLITHTTTGGSHAAVVSAGSSFMDNLSAGVTAYYHFGNVLSSLRGDNHGRDAAKWATLESKVRGYSLRLGAIYRFDGLSVGLTYQPPFVLDVQQETAVSPDSQYSAFFPPDKGTAWSIPSSLRAGIAVRIFADALFVLDIEQGGYRKPEARFNLYEYGNESMSTRFVAVRLGTEFHPFDDAAIPVRVGYAYVPQAYASSEALGTNSGNVLRIDESRDTDRNVRHGLTVGTTLRTGVLHLTPSLEFSWLSWTRRVSGQFAAENEYSETTITASLGIEF